MNIKAKLQPLIDLTRINKPTGIWLLFLPCLFGIFLSYKTNPDINIKLLITIFLTGSLLMRTAGCVINDIFDRKLDKKVKRTKSRPIANDKINIWASLSILALLLSAGLYILLQFNELTRTLGVAAFVLIIIYPLAKRFTYFPQLFLGITFNFGILIAAGAINNLISTPIVLLYISAICWTLIYDTIYAYQDIEDDMKIGIKSTAIKFGAKPQKILYALSITQILLLVSVGILLKFQLTYYFMIYMALFHLLCQIKTCDFKNPEDCLAKFKASPFTGCIILMGIILG
jgi:4-hydroxybenzoate polyprenyl transferase